ncbi:hypothetical protein PYW07_012223 [Mythimna separata]|uniref:Uncharacterized protein n=1 Tax=Mythimna separata TaxID=271217 RepID=A0AAD8DSM9_MYTSE|nr:hypothetical protein PYW07_012223 [Mythimna separata]
MSKFSGFLLCVLAVSLSSVHVTKAQTLRQSVRPVIAACSQEHGVTDAEIQAAKEAGSAASLKPCFIGCVLKKIGLINDKGDYDLDSGLKGLRQFVKDDEKYNKLANVARACSKVQDKAVTDGTAGCERSVLVADCFLTYKARIII